MNRLKPRIFAERVIDLSCIFSFVEMIELQFQFDFIDLAANLKGFLKWRIRRKTCRMLNVSLTKAKTTVCIIRCLLQIEGKWKMFYKHQ